MPPKPHIRLRQERHVICTGTVRCDAENIGYLRSFLSRACAVEYHREKTRAKLSLMGSPSVYMSPAFEYTDPAQLLQDRRGRLTQRAWEGWKLKLVMVTEYVVTLAAIANIATINWKLGVKTIC